MAKKDLKRETQCNFLLKRETFQIKRDLKETQKVVKGLLRDQGLPKRDPVGSSGGGAK